MSGKQLALAIDVGGTKVTVGVVDASGQIHTQATTTTQPPLGDPIPPLPLWERRVNARSAEGRSLGGGERNLQERRSRGEGNSPADILLSRITSLAQQLIAQTPDTSPPPSTACIATTGHVDARHGAVLHSGLVPGWSGLPLGERLEALLDIPVAVRNDGHAMAVAEHRLGAARGYGHVLCVAVGTGVGGGLIEDGRLLLGARGLAGLIGHSTIAFNGRRCQCGKRGCLEAYAAGPRIVDEYHRLRRNHSPAAPEGSPTQHNQIGRPSIRRHPASLQEVTQLAESGDPIAITALERGGAYLGAGLASLANALNPQRIVVGGGVLGAGPRWFDSVRRTTLERARHTVAEGLDVVPAALGPQAVLVGAGLIALDA